MGMLYMTGEAVATDYDEAKRWFKLAAAQDFEPAIDQLSAFE